MRVRTLLLALLAACAAAPDAPVIDGPVRDGPVDDAPAGDAPADEGGPAADGPAPDMTERPDASARLDAAPPDAPARCTVDAGVGPVTLAAGRTDVAMIALGG